MAHADAAKQLSFMAACTSSAARNASDIRHVELSNAAFFACRNLLDINDDAGEDHIKPTPATRKAGQRWGNRHRRLLAIVRDDEVCRRLMTIPGVGPWWR
jgi:hypothetical protein